MPSTPTTPLGPDAVVGLRTADLVDAMGRRHRHRCHILDLVSPTPDRVLFGPAATISYFPTCDAAIDPGRHDFATLFHAAVGASPAGKVLVLASNGAPDVSLGGGTKLARLDRFGLAGLLTDGRIRDFAELADRGASVWCHGEATHWGGADRVPFRADEPVVVAGVAVFPGDHVFADRSGAVVIPAGEVEDVIAEARRIGDEDEDARRRIADEPIGGWPSGRDER